jgi:2-haloacid dehalogenase
MTEAVVFDVNETLLDLGVLEPFFERVFGDAGVRKEWFGQLLQGAMTLTMTGAYQDFVAVGAGALTVVAARHRVTITDDERAEIRRLMTSLPPHPDTEGALETLQQAGLRLAALTNSPRAAAEAQLQNAGVADRFDEILSVEGVERYKPAPEPYRMAADRLGIATSEMWMVAAHDWDVAGAMAAGCRGALVTRPGVVVNPLYPPPDVVANDLHQVGEGILDAER